MRNIKTETMQKNDISGNGRGNMTTKRATKSKIHSTGTSRRSLNGTVGLPERKYTVLCGTSFLSGTAMQILEGIRREASAPEAHAMSTAAFARAIIADADYFIPSSTLRQINKYGFRSNAERSLMYLAVQETMACRVMTFLPDYLQRCG